MPDEMNYNDFIPNSFQIPNIFVDKILPNLSEIEVKVYLVIVRKTLGWRKEYDSISLSQFKGILNIKDDRTIQSAISKLLQKDFIIKVEKPGYPSQFAINLNPLHVHGRGHTDVPPTSSCANSLHVDEEGVPPSTCTPQKTIKPTNTKNTLSREVDFKTFKKELLRLFPNFEFKLAYPNRFNYIQYHRGFCFKNDLIYDLHTKKFMSREESFEMWNYIFENRVQMVQDAELQKNQTKEF